MARVSTFTNRSAELWDTSGTESLFGIMNAPDGQRSGHSNDAESDAKRDRGSSPFMITECVRAGV
jgi:hypothetical protein